MVITSVKIYVFPESNSNSKMKAVASIVIDGVFAVNDIKVLYANERFFIAMPSKPKKQSGFMDIAHPINEIGRKLIEATILYAFNKAIDSGATIFEMTRNGYSANIFDFDPNNYAFAVIETERPKTVQTIDAKKAQTADTKKKTFHAIQDDNWQKWFNS